MISPVVVVFDKVSDGLLQFARHLVRQSVKVPLECTVISLNLAVFNLVPFPLLDVGWLLVIIVEKIK